MPVAATLSVTGVPEATLAPTGCTVSVTGTFTVTAAGLLVALPAALRTATV